MDFIKKILPTLWKMIEFDKYCAKSKEKPKFLKKEVSYCLKCGKKNK